MSLIISQVLETQNVELSSEIACFPPLGRQPRKLGLRAGELAKETKHIL